MTPPPLWQVALAKREVEQATGVAWADLAGGDKRVPPSRAVVSARTRAVAALVGIGMCRKRIAECIGVAGWTVDRREASPRLGNVRLVTVGDVTMSLTEWSREMGIARTTVANRIRRGWPPEKAVTMAPSTIFEERRVARREASR